MSREVTGHEDASWAPSPWLGVQTACLQCWELLGCFVNASTSAVISCAPPPCVKCARAGSPWSVQEKPVCVSPPCAGGCGALGCSSQTPEGSPSPSARLPAPAIPGYSLKYGPHFLFLHLLQMQITDESINYTNHYSEEHLSNCWTWTEQLVVNLLYNHCLQQEGKCFNCANIMKGEVNHRDKF